MTRKETEKRKQKIIKLRSQGLTHYEIAKHLGMQTQLVSYYLKNDKQSNHLETAENASKE